MRPHFTGLWRHPDFVKLWAAQTVSLSGSLIGRFALPLVAIIALEASPAEVALLRVADMVPGIVVGLLAGAWVDRLRRRPLMIWADLGRALLLVSIPLAALQGVLRVEQLFLVAFATGVLTTLFDVAYQAYLPTLVRRDELVEGNSKLQASGAVVEVASFGIAGWLVQVLTAPIAILLDAISFLLSALSLGLIRAPESPPAPAAERRSVWLEIREGLRVVLGDPVLRALAGAKGTHDFFLFMWVAMLMLFLTRELHLEPLLFGMIFAVGGVTALLGAVMAERAVRRWGLGRTLVISFFLSSASTLFVPLAGGPFLLVVALVSAQQLFDGAAVVYEINEASLVQSITPGQLLGRVTASLRCVGWCAMLAGALAGGALGETIGPRATMVIGGVGASLSVAWLIASPIRTLRAMPTAP